MDLADLFKRMQQGEVSAHSELGTRDEAKQSRNFAARLQKMKLTPNIAGHVLMMKDVVIPFDPFTCAETETYNARTPFRPILLVSQVLEGIKKVCSQNEELAAKWNEILGENVDWSAPVSMDDYFLFKRREFIFPRLMSYTTVTLNFNGACGFPELAQQYTVDPTLLDEDNNYPPDVNPIHNQAAIFFNMMLKKEIDEVVGALERNGATKETIASQRQAIRGKSPVSFIRQTNLVPYLFFQKDTEPEKFDPKQVTNFEHCIRWSKYNTEKWGGAIKEAMEDNRFDESMDFFGLYMRTPRSTETKSDGSVYTDNDTLDLYKAMTITNTDSRLSIFSGHSTIDGRSIPNNTLFAPVFEAAKAYFMHSQEQSSVENGDTFEKLMALSHRFRPIESVMDKFLQACNQVFLSQFANTKYYTPEIKKANSEFFVSMDANNAMAIAEFDDDELQQAADQQKESLNAILVQAREDDQLLSADNALVDDLIVDVDVDVV